MAVKTIHVKLLIETLAEKFNCTLDYFGFGELSQYIPNDAISQRYLDDTYRKVNKYEAEGRAFCGCRVYYLNFIAEAIGYPNFNSFSRECDKGNSDILESCSGTWKSYVRANYGDFILIAPFEIYVDELKRVRARMKGSERLYEGTIMHLGSMMYVQLDSSSDKKFFMVFRLGSTRKISLLQGLFCGASSGGHPISGRTLLVREHERTYEQLQWKQVNAPDPDTDARINNYFASYEMNCLKITNSSAFNIDDLNSM